MPEIFSKFNDVTADLIKAGAVGVIPTDTIYGLVCSASNSAAVQRLYRFKSRVHANNSKPGTIIAASIDQLVELGIKARYLKAVDHYWPNPISVIMPTGSALEYLHLGKQSLAVRLPKPVEILQFLERSGPLLTTSANHPGQPEATTILRAQEYFGNSVDFYVDGGDLSVRQPSTLIRIIDDAIEVLRQGAVTIDEAGRIA